jgi:uncharacterized protein YggE
VRDESAFRQRALTQAAQDAKGKAETIARGFGVRLGKLLDVNEAGAPIVIPFVAKAEAGAAPGTPISPQQVQVRANLTATYAIAP